MLDGRTWRRAAGASPAAIARLRMVAPVALPESYYALLAFSDGGEGPLAVQPLWLCLHPADEVARTAADGIFQDDFPGLFVIGGNGGGEAVAFDLRAGAPYPMVAFDLTNIDLTESIAPIAPSFDAALALIGRDAPP